MAAAATSSLTGTPATGAGPFSQEECVSIAQEYDGRTQTIDRLLEAWSLRKANLKRHHIHKAAVRGGYAPCADRKAWNDTRNKAAHGKYSEYTKDQVALLIQSVRDFITRNPA